MSYRPSMREGEPRRTGYSRVIPLASHPLLLFEGEHLILDERHTPCCPPRTRTWNPPLNRRMLLPIELVDMEQGQARNPP